MVLENFNIVDAAGGPGKAIIKTFNVSVTQNTLEIQFYWAGKGTTGIPNRGTYGPLVSAISVTPSVSLNFLKFHPFFSYLIPALNIAFDIKCLNLGQRLHFGLVDYNWHRFLLNLFRRQ